MEILSEQQQQPSLLVEHLATKQKHMETVTIQSSLASDDGTISEVVEFLNQHFLPHEPMNISIGLIQPGYRIPFFDAMVRSHLEREDTLLVTARDTETGEMMGVAVFIMER